MKMSLHITTHEAEFLNVFIYYPIIYQKTMAWTFAVLLMGMEADLNHSIRRGIMRHHYQVRMSTLNNELNYGLVEEKS